jgi:hypothetical protein
MSSKTRKKKLKKRLQWTFQVEGMNVVMFFVILVFLNLQYDFKDLIFLSYGMVLMCYILFQGTYYWWVKFSKIDEQTVFERTVLSRFRTFKKHNQIALLLIPVVLAVQWFVSGKHFIGDNLIGWAIFANLFAICEYVNYYHKQLMYDNRSDINYLLKHRQLKEASLFKDLRENKI